MDVWGPARVRGQGQERYFLLVVTTTRVTPQSSLLRSKGEVTAVLIDWIRAARLQLREELCSDFPVLRLHSDRGGEFSSGLLECYCRARGIRQTFTLPDSPQQNGIAERRIGMVMDVAHQPPPQGLSTGDLPSPAVDGKVGDASAFRVWGSRAFVRDLTADKLSPVLLPASSWGSPRRPWVAVLPPHLSTCVLSSQDVTFDESDAVEPVEVTGDSVLLRELSLEPGGAVPGGAEPGGAEPGGAEPRGAELGVLSLGVLSLGVLSLGVLCLGVLRLAGSHSPHRSCVSGLPGAGGVLLVLVVFACTGAAEGVGAEPAAGGPTDSAPGAATGGSGASGGAAGGAAGVGAPDGGAGAFLLFLVSPLFGHSHSYSLPPLCLLLLPTLVRLEVLLSVVSLRLVLRRLFVLSALVVAGRVSVLLLSLARTGCHWRPSTAPLRAPLPSPPPSSLPALADPESDSLRAASPTVTRLLATAVTDPSFESSAASALVTELVDFAARCRLDYAARLVAESESVCPPSVGGECALGTDVLEDRQEELQCLAAASPHLASVLLAPEGDPDALDIPTPRSYAEAVEGPYSSQWQAAMDAEMASWKSTGTYVDAVPPPGANIVSGMWIFRVKRPPGSPPVFKARYVARGFSQRQGVDYFQTFFSHPEDDHSSGAAAHCRSARLRASLSRLQHCVPAG
ncbi:unnamed protein product [Closterium sp. NIES-64]|nr:unnamed protein product [Closterium sp. NIES-64]